MYHATDASTHDHQNLDTLTSKINFKERSTHLEDKIKISDLDKIEVF